MSIKVTFEHPKLDEPRVFYADHLAIQMLEGGVVDDEQFCSSPNYNSYYFCGADSVQFYLNEKEKNMETLNELEEKRIALYVDEIIALWDAVELLNSMRCKREALEAANELGEWRELLQKIQELTNDTKARKRHLVRKELQFRLKRIKAHKEELLARGVDADEIQLRTSHEWWKWQKVHQALLERLPSETEILGTW